MQNIQKSTHYSNGFNLIELMVVTAVLGILVSVALSSYYTYSVRARVLEGISLASSIKAEVSENYAEGKLIGLTTYAATLATEVAAGNIATAMVSDLTLDPATGVITVVYNTNNATGGIPELVGANTIALTPHIGNQGLGATIDGGTISWECAGADGAIALTSYPASTLGSVTSRFLPGECR
ncbi:MAG: pilin [Gammaproteobacteria bacterium]|nr:pilin [Gammaproteobacteria bacterium]